MKSKEILNSIKFILITCIMFPILTEKKKLCVNYNEISKWKLAFETKYASRLNITLILLNKRINTHTPTLHQLYFPRNDNGDDTQEMTWANYINFHVNKPCVVYLSKHLLFLLCSCYFSVSFTCTWKSNIIKLKVNRLLLLATSLVQIHCFFEWNARIIVLCWLMMMLNLLY